MSAPLEAINEFKVPPKTKAKFSSPTVPKTPRAVFDISLKSAVAKSTTIWSAISDMPAKLAGTATSPSGIIGN